MKFSLAALLGAVYGHNEAELFMQEEVSLAVVTGDLADKIGSGSCQAYFGDNIFDMKAFDQMNRNMEKHTAALADAEGNNLFAYKMCQNEFTLDANVLGGSFNSTVEDMLKQKGFTSGSGSVGACPNKGNAYLLSVDADGNIGCE